MGIGLGHCGRAVRAGLLFGAVLVVCPAAGAQYQDALVAAPQRYKLAFENQAVRVIRVEPDAAQATPMHTHPGFPMMQVTFTEIHSITTNANGTTRESHREARTVRYSAGGPEMAHSTKRLSDAPSRSMRIESKLQADPSIVPGPPLADSHFAVEQDNADFRVTRGKFAAVEKPRLKLSLTRPAVLIFFGKQKWRVRDEKGHKKNSTFEDGDFLIQQPGHFRLDKKLAAREAEVLVVELKGRLK